MRPVTAGRWPLERAGDDEAALDMDRLFRSEAPRLRLWFSARTRDIDAANDMVQETFLRLSSNEAHLRLRNPAAWLQRVARNLLIDKARRDASRQAHLHVPLDEAMDAGVAPDQAARIEAGQLLESYERAIAQLTERTRQVFLLHRVEGLSYRQIAERLAISVSTVEYHMMRALAHLDRVLDDA